MPFKKIIAFCVLFATMHASAQNSLSYPRNIATAYDKKTRTNNGDPGINYWQNTADYDLKVNFDPVTRMLNGVADINYINNSPDTLGQIWFKFFPNLYKKGSPTTFNISAEDLTDGLIVDSFWINNQSTPVKRLNINATNVILGRQSLAHGQRIQFRFVYHYTLNKGSHIRTGEIDPGADFVAYFFPRISVYDDIDGWNTYPYNGTQEFYNDFGTFKASITVPTNTVVWATGDLTNCSEVFNEKYCGRIQAAEKSDAVTTIIDTTDLKEGNITRQNPTNTWKFVATDVSDFVFAVSDHYMWKSSSVMVNPKTGRRTRVDAVFNPKHKDYFEVIDFARKTVDAMSYVFPKWPYPYSHETVFDGLDQMEYPMMVNDNPLDNREDAITLTDHEIFHTMFPFYMGINETKYAWMDEGWATIGEWLISTIIDTTINDRYGIDPVSNNAGKETDLPIITLSTETYRSYFTNSYPKPGMGYLFIKDMLGDSLFNKALHYYIEKWHGKHPSPYDFFNCMNTGAGKNMNWFWKKWFIENGVPDLAVQKVNKAASGYTIIVESKGAKPLPVDVIISFSDGSETTIHRSIAVWEKGNKTVSIPLATKKVIDKVKLYAARTPDADQKNNIWEKK